MRSRAVKETYGESLQYLARSGEGWEDAGTIK